MGFSPAGGFVGGMMIGWNSHQQELISLEYGLYSISTKFSSKEVHKIWWFSCIYGPPTSLEKEDFWTRAF